MEEKSSYSPEEVAMICEAWRKVGESNDSDAMENLKKYKILAPQSVQHAVTCSRNIEYAYYGKTPEQIGALGELEKCCTRFNKFKEFFEVFV
jgi:hypothetical protein